MPPPPSNSESEMLPTTSTLTSRTSPDWIRIPPPAALVADAAAAQGLGGGEGAAVDDDLATGVGVHAAALAARAVLAEHAALDQRGALVLAGDRPARIGRTVVGE